MPFSPAAAAEDLRARRLRAWVDSMVETGVEWLVLQMPQGNDGAASPGSDEVDSANAASRRSSNLPPAQAGPAKRGPGAKVLERMRSELSQLRSPDHLGHWDRIVRREPPPGAGGDVSRSLDSILDEVAHRAKWLAMRALVKRAAAYTTECERLFSRADHPGWNFCAYLVRAVRQVPDVLVVRDSARFVGGPPCAQAVREGQAETLAQMHQLPEALRVFDELVDMFVRRWREPRAHLGVGEGSDEADSNLGDREAGGLPRCLEDLVPSPALRGAVHSSAASSFSILRYLFLRQAALLSAMGQPSWDLVDRLKVLVSWAAKHCLAADSGTPTLAAISRRRAAWILAAGVAALAGPAPAQTGDQAAGAPLARPLPKGLQSSDEPSSASFRALFPQMGPVHPRVTSCRHPPTVGTALERTVLRAEFELAHGLRDIAARAAAPEVDGAGGWQAFTLTGRPWAPAAPPNQPGSPRGSGNRGGGHTPPAGRSRRHAAVPLPEQVDMWETHDIIAALCAPRPTPPSPPLWALCHVLSGRLTVLASLRLQALARPRLLAQFTLELAEADVARGRLEQALPTLRDLSCACDVLFKGWHLVQFRVHALHLLCCDALLESTLGHVWDLARCAEHVADDLGNDKLPLGSWALAPIATPGIRQGESTTSPRAVVDELSKRIAAMATGREKCLEGQACDSLPLISVVITPLDTPHRDQDGELRLHAEVRNALPVELHVKRVEVATACFALRDHMRSLNRPPGALERQPSAAAVWQDVRLSGAVENLPADVRQVELRRRASDLGVFELQLVAEGVDVVAGGAVSITLTASGRPPAGEYRAALARIDLGPLRVEHLFPRGPAAHFVVTSPGQVRLDLPASQTVLRCEGQGLLLCVSPEGTAGGQLGSSCAIHVEAEGWVLFSGASTPQAAYGWIGSLSKATDAAQSRFPLPISINAEGTALEITALPVLRPDDRLWIAVPLCAPVARPTALPQPAPGVERAPPARLVEDVHVPIEVRVTFEGEVTSASARARGSVCLRAPFQVSAGEPVRLSDKSLSLEATVTNLSKRVLRVGGCYFAGRGATADVLAPGVLDDLLLEPGDKMRVAAMLRPGGGHLAAAGAGVDVTVAFSEASAAAGPRHMAEVLLHGPERAPNSFTASLALEFTPWLVDSVSLRLGEIPRTASVGVPFEVPVVVAGAGDPTAGLQHGEVRVNTAGTHWLVMGHRVRPVRLGPAGHRLTLALLPTAPGLEPLPPVEVWKATDGGMALVADLQQADVVVEVAGRAHRLRSTVRP